MSSTVNSRASTRIFSVMIAAVLGVGLSACSASGESATPTQSPSVPSVASPTPQPTVLPSPTPTAIMGTPIALDCNALIPAQAMYDFNPNFVLKHDYTPKPESQAAIIVKAKGLACAWVNETSSDLIEVAVAKLDSATINNLENNLVESSNPVPTYGDEAYFKMEGQAGTAEVFSGSYWIVAKSPAFYEPGDASPIVDTSIQSLAKK